MSFIKFKPLKNLLGGLKSTGGRNNQGRVSLKGRGGGHSKKYRKINWSSNFRNKLILGIEYNPNQSNFLLRTVSSKLNQQFYQYFVGINNIKIFDSIDSRLSNITTQLGEHKKLENFDVGDIISNIEQNPKKGPTFVRSAGTSGLITQKSQKKNKYCVVKLPSGEQRLFSKNCIAVYGKNANKENQERTIKKAGTQRWLGLRPKVRGVAKNPIDHPHGGGEGKTSGGRPSVTPKGRPTRNVSTRSPRKKTTFVFSKRK